MRYPSYSEIIFINGRILNDPLIQSGKQKVRDLDMLLAAEQRPQASAFGQDAYPELSDKAGALLHALARNHPFKDGNKRTAVVASLFMLAINGWQVRWDMHEALGMVLDLAEGRRSLSDYTAWLTLTPGQPQEDPDLALDMAIIDTLIDEQKWLLDELATR